MLQLKVQQRHALNNTATIHRNNLSATAYCSHADYAAVTGKVELSESGGLRAELRWGSQKPKTSILH